MGALFTCLSTRAIHHEIAGSLTTDSAIMAINRFTARRGEPACIFSDNGSNFKGEAKELKEATAAIDKTNQHQTWSQSQGCLLQVHPTLFTSHGRTVRNARQIRESITGKHFIRNRPCRRNITHSAL